MGRFFVGRHYLLLAVAALTSSVSTATHSDELRFDSSQSENARTTNEAILANASFAEQAEFMCAMIKVLYYETPGVMTGDGSGAKPAIDLAMAKATDGKTLKEVLEHARSFPPVPKGAALVMGITDLDAVCAP